MQGIKIKFRNCLESILGTKGSYSVQEPDKKVEKVGGKIMEKTGKRNQSLLSVLKILLLMYVVTGIMLLVLTMLLSKLQLTESAVSVGIVAIYVVSGFLGGLLTGKKMKNRKFIWGMVMGGCYFLVLVLGSILFHKGLDMEASRFLTTLILCTASGMVGGMVS